VCSVFRRNEEFFKTQFNPPFLCFSHLHDVQDNGGKRNNPSVVAKEVEKLKNFGTINISDNTEEERSNFNKRTTPSTNFVRSGSQCKRQNTAKEAVKGHEHGADTTNVPFSSDYRRRFNPEVIFFSKYCNIFGE
jgi:hypothetical protein